jgi:hypothetical protein
VGDSWTDPRVLAPIISAGAACVALIINAVAVNKNNRKIELDTFDRIHTKIVEIERRLYDAAATNNEALLQTWRGELLNSLEYVSFLFNHNYLEDRQLREYWSPSIIVWHERFFLEQSTDSQKQDPTLYMEFKTLYQELKSNQSSSTISNTIS